ncbi:MAG: single-stranded DNA-binding protein [Gemmataceae bacterium]|nr:single-stranded DNA-binding protein [Gemmataceae bacterium]
MANLNKVMLIGRLTRDPECRAFSNGGKVAKFGFAVNNRAKNSQTGQWEDVPVWLDCEAYNRGDYGKLADRVEQYLKKGSQVYLEGHLKLDQWDDKTTGQKRSALRIVVDEMQFLDSRSDGGGRGPGGPRSQQASAPGDSYNDSHGGDDFGSAPSPAAGGPAEESIPF